MLFFDIPGNKRHIYVKFSEFFCHPYMALYSTFLNLRELSMLQFNKCILFVCAKSSQIFHYQFSVCCELFRVSPTCSKSFQYVTELNVVFLLGNSGQEGDSGPASECLRTDTAQT